MDVESKYTRVEYERRFLVRPDVDWKSHVEPYLKLLEDKYLHNTRLRLRVLTDSDTGRRLVKLTKKSESASPYFRAINRILLSPDEHDLLDALEGSRLKKTRYYHNYLGHVFSIDVFKGMLEGLILCETEADSLEELMSIEPPPFVEHEVTENEFFTGGKLCRITQDELLRNIGKIS